MANDTRSRLALKPEQLRRVCDPSTIGDGPAASDIFGQESALAAVELGLLMTDGNYAKSHYNIAVVGSPNTGRTTKTMEFLKRHAVKAERKAPDAICLHDFSAPRRPLIAFVPAGAGRALKQMLQALRKFATEKLKPKTAIFRQQRQNKLEEAHEKLWQTCAEKVQAFGWLLVETEDQGKTIVPMSLAKPGSPMGEEEFAQLAEDVKDKVMVENQEKAATVFNATILATRALIENYNKDTETIIREQVEKIVGKLIEPLRHVAGKNGALDQYLVELQKHIIEYGLHQESQRQPALMILGKQPGGEEPGDVLTRLMEVNLLVDNSGNEHPPVVNLPVPNYSLLFGRINAQVVNTDGAVRVDHTMVEAGALLKANGGYLVLDMNDLLRWGGGIAFYKLLQVLRTRKLVIEGKSKFLDAEATLDYRSHEVPIDVRVVVICDRQLDHLLRQFEQEFASLFRIVSEFDDEMDAEDAPAAYKAFVAACRADTSLPEFSNESVAKLVEYGIRRTDNRLRASAEFGILKDVINEAAHWAIRGGSLVVGPEHVTKAVQERFKRQALGVRRYQEFLDKKMLLDHEGAKVGQINAYVVMQHSDEIKFGAPQRVTAQAYAGTDKVVLVQREVKMSGPTMNASIEELIGYISGKYGRKKPLQLTVQLCFEQCYGGIEGDSASLAEAIATISSITGLPVDQRLGITGSMNQMGEAQPIGGINEKIEGHFGALKRRGLLTTGHGAVMPKRNLDNLMLDEEVIEACRNGLYEVIAISTLDEALEIFLGKPAEEIHALVQEKLDEMSRESAKEKAGPCCCQHGPDKQDK